MSFPPGTEMFQFPGFASSCLCIQHEITSTPNSNRPAARKPQVNSNLMKRLGFPIRKSVGQRLLTPHHSLSQRACPSSPVHAKASTICPYLTLETRTTNDSTEAARRQYCPSSTATTEAGKDPATMPHGIRFSKPIHNIKEGRFRPVYRCGPNGRQQTGCLILEADRKNGGA